MLSQSLGRIFRHSNKNWHRSRKSLSGLGIGLGLALVACQNKSTPRKLLQTLPRPKCPLRWDCCCSGWQQKCWISLGCCWCFWYQINSFPCDEGLVQILRQLPAVRGSPELGLSFLSDSFAEKGWVARSQQLQPCSAGWIILICGAEFLFLGWMICALWLNWGLPFHSSCPTLFAWN